MSKVLFFSPSADIWEHSFPEALCAEQLVLAGEEVLMIRCNGALLPLCPAGQAAGLKPSSSAVDQESVCRRCRHKADLIDSGMNLPRRFLEDFIEPSDSAEIEALVLKADAMRCVLRKAEDFGALQMAGVEVGRSALYDLILRHKKSDYELSDDQWREYLVFLRLAAQVALLSGRILVTSKPSAVCVYNSLYVAHRAFCRQAVRLEIPQYFMHAGTNLARQHGTLMIGRDFTWRFLLSLVERFETVKKLEVDARVVDDASDHIAELFAANNPFVFSAGRSSGYMDVRSHFGVDERQSLIVASTSSYDERFAVEAVGAFDPPKALLFPRILDWVSFLIEETRSRPDWFLLIRVHPREFPNRRDAVTSAHAQQMKVLLRDLPANVRVNWPDEKISLYDLAQEADVFLNAWSSVGKEMALLGLPVVLYSPELVLYPPSLNFVGTTRRAYLGAVEAALADGWSLDHSLCTYRWLGVEFSRSLVDMRRSFSPRRRYALKLWQRVAIKALKMFDIAPLERLDVMRRKSMPRAQQVIQRLFTQRLSTSYDAQDQAEFSGSAADELSAIRRNLRQLGTQLFAANPAGRPSKLQRRFAQAGLVELSKQEHVAR